MAQVAAVIALDWADAKQDSGLLDASTHQQESCILKHTPEEREGWATALRPRLAGQKRAVCREQSRGPLIYALLQYDFFVLSPFTPTTLATYREAFASSRAKDDPREAAYRLEVLLQPRERLKAWRPDHAKTRTLQDLVEHRRRLVNDRTRISQRMTARLQAYFPQVG